MPRPVAALLLTHLVWPSAACRVDQIQNDPTTTHCPGKLMLINFNHYNFFFAAWWSVCCPMIISIMHPSTHSSVKLLYISRTSYPTPLRPTDNQSTWQNTVWPHPSSVQCTKPSAVSFCNTEDKQGFGTVSSTCSSRASAFARDKAVHRRNMTFLPAPSFGFDVETEEMITTQCRTTNGLNRTGAHTIDCHIQRGRGLNSATNMF